jgi:hypothetical protein
MKARIIKASQIDPDNWTAEHNIARAEAAEQAEPPLAKLFKVASVSSNANSFGLRGMILMAQDGEAWEVGANALNVKQKGAIVAVEIVNDQPAWATLGYEIPRELGKAPAKVVREVWPA